MGEREGDRIGKDNSNSGYLSTTVLYVGMLLTFFLTAYLWVLCHTSKMNYGKQVYRKLEETSTIEASTIRYLIISISLILEKWDRTRCNIEKIKPCTQTNETTFIYIICTKLLHWFKLPMFFLSKYDFYLGLCNIMSTLSLTAINIFLIAALYHSVCCTMERQQSSLIITPDWEYSS